MTKRDYYEILGIPRDAAPETIKRSYRQMALKYHPDRNPGDRESEEKFKEAAEAYSVLIDSEKRSVYDRFGHDGLRGEGFSGFSGFNSSIFADFEDILGSFFNFGFDSLFGTSRQRRPKHPSRGRDLALELDLQLEDVVFGTEKEIKINRTELCPECDGSRMKSGTEKSVCPHCQGRGQVRYQQGFFVISRTCSDCHGHGEIIPFPCKDCRGTGRIKKKKTLTVKIPPGVDNGTKLRLEGEGETGDPGAERGDLYVITHVKRHKFFQREGNSLFCEISIPFTKAALGSTIEIPTFDGAEPLRIPEGTQTGQTFRLKGKGIKDLYSHRKGDIFIKVLVKTPKNLSKEQKKHLRLFAESRGDKLEGVDKSITDKFKDII
ncbi:MAG: molecular chaperone DnaJ [Candidatus Aminicenantes bacterium]|nr:MAG: molecular chaperone DnaJ [Candidatus Aminicenantes bacterium]